MSDPTELPRDLSRASTTAANSAAATAPGAAPCTYGLIVELSGHAGDAPPELRFISARIAQRVVPRAVVSSLPGSQLGICQVGGLILPVVELGPAATELILCDLPRHAPEREQAGKPDAPPPPSECLAVSGARVLASGAFERRGAAVMYAGQPVMPLDLELLAEHL